ncbi:MAG: hypothetical protein VKJ02_11970 [Snowella sp.]|nr:hypothetical protein [Snowella sp.]
MEENPDKIIFFIDRCLGNQQIAAAIKSLGISVETHDQHFPKNALDIEWIPKIAEKRWIILTKDERIGKNALERQVLARSGLRMFTLAAQGLSGEEMVSIFQKAIIPMQKFIEKNPAPFIAKIYRNGDVKAWKTAEVLLAEIKNIG